MTLQEVIFHDIHIFSEEVQKKNKLTVTPAHHLQKSQLATEEINDSMSKYDQMLMEMNNLRTERDLSIEKLKYTEGLLAASKLSPDSVKCDDEKCIALTGMGYFCGSGKILVTIYSRAHKD